MLRRSSRIRRSSGGSANKCFRLNFETPTHIADNVTLSNQRSDTASFLRGVFTLLYALLLVFSVTSTSVIAQDDLEEDPKRIALVIGNEHYTSLMPLASARTDAERIKQRLIELGFEVEYYADVKTYFEFEQGVLPSFRKKLGTGDFIVFYFSGHGFAHGPDNFLAPTEIPLEIPANKVVDHAISIDAFKGVLETHTPGLIIFIIDACRSVGEFKVADPNKQNVLAKGPAVMRNGHRAVNTFIAYATEPGKIAMGNSEPGQLSAFTRSLVEYIHTEGVRFSAMFDEVASDVRSSTDPQQVPGTFDWSETDPFLKPTEKNYADEREAWRTARESEDYRKVQRYSHRFSVSRHSAAARRWLEKNKDRADADRFSRVSPLAIERAWEISTDEIVSIRRVETPVALSRSVELSNQEMLTHVSDADLGLLPAGTTLHQLAELRTGEKYLEEALGANWARMSDSRKALAFSLANLDAHDRVVATETLIARSRPSVGAEVVARIPAGAKLEVHGVTVGQDRGLWLHATKRGEPWAFYFKADETATPAILELGRSLKEIVVPKRPHSIPELVDSVPIEEALKDLRKGGHTITWVSLSTALTTDELERDSRALRLANAEHILKNRGITGTRITSVSGSQDFTHDGVRIRFYGKEPEIKWRRK